MVMEAWQTSWKAFLEAVASQVINGCTDDEIAEIFAGKDVQWRGTVSHLKLHSKFVPGVELTMPIVKLPLKDGKYIQENHLYVLVATKDKAQWEGLNEGTVVSFKAHIKELSDTGPFRPIRLFFNNDGHVNVQISADKGCLV